MKQFAFPLGDQPALTIRSHADLRLTGWDRPDAAVDSAPGYSLKVEQDKDGLRITCLDDCEVFLPLATHVTIDKVSGNLKVVNLAGTLMIEKVGGSAEFSKVGAVQAGKIGGDCEVSGAAGNFAVGKIGGSLQGSQFAGDLLIEKAGGDIELSGVEGAFLARAGGSIEAQLMEGFGPRVELRAGGDLSLHLPENAEGRYFCSCSADEIEIDLPGRREQVESGHYEFTLGNPAAAQVDLRSGGSMEITSRPFEMKEDFLRGHSFTGGWPDFSGITENAINRAARMTEDAMRRAERRVEAAFRGLEGREPVIVPPPPPVTSQPPAQGAAAFVPAAEAPGPVQPPAPVPASGEVSDDERLLILKMLQEKKISVEEAEMLIEALENPGQSA